MDRIDSCFRFFAILALSFGGFRALGQPPTVELEAMQVSAGGMITVWAPDSFQRGYGERFTEMVYEAATATSETSAGKGLVVIAGRNDPHPIVLVKRFLEAVENDELAGEMTVFGKRIDAATLDWKKMEEKAREEMGEDIDLETVINVIPIPMEGTLLNLYFIAREEEFDEQRIDARFRSLTPSDLENANFETFEWAIFLPRKDAIDDAIKEVLPAAMKKAEVGFFARALVRGAVFTFKPLIRDAMEAVRKAMLYEIILRKTSALNEGDIKALADAYRDALMPKGKIIPGKKEDRSLEAIREQVAKNEEYAKDPFIAPDLLKRFELATYSKFEGAYQVSRGIAAFYYEGGIYKYDTGKGNAKDFLPASDSVFVSLSRDMTIEFFTNESGSVEEMEVRRERFRTKHKRADRVLPAATWVKSINKIAPLEPPAMKLGMGGGNTILTDEKEDWRRGRTLANQAALAVNESVGRPSGKGLLVMGGKQDLHPIRVMETFLKATEKKELDSVVSEVRKQIANEMVARKPARVFGLASDAPEFREAIPYRMNGPVLDLWLIAKEEGGDLGRIKRRFSDLASSEVEGFRHSKFDWSAFVPPEQAFDKAFRAARVKAKDKDALKGELEMCGQYELYRIVLSAMGGVDESKQAELREIYWTALKSGQAAPWFRREFVDTDSEVERREVVVEVNWFENAEG